MIVLLLALWGTTPYTSVAPNAQQAMQSMRCLWRDNRNKADLVCWAWCGAAMHVQRYSGKTNRKVGHEKVLPKARSVAFTCSVIATAP